ncbi:MAG: NADPH-dependent FMN reductase [Phycisphaerae bacterium]|nr:NADPH-dependent FMN reductase [Phycisphaerae bacterium]
MTPRILAFSGSIRRDSLNQKLIEIASEDVREAGGEITVINLKDYQMPVFNQDLEDEGGLPDAVLQLKDVFRDHQGLLIASPEYNGSLTAVLKNTIDWLTRPQEGFPPLDCFSGKIAAILATSPGGRGGLMGLSHLRAILTHIKTIVIPHQVAVPNAHQAIGNNDRIEPETIHDMVRHQAVQLVETTRRMHI